MIVGLGLLNQAQARSGVELFEARVGARLVAAGGPWGWRVYTRGIRPPEWSGLAGFEERVCAPRGVVRGGRLWSEQVSWALELARRPVDLVASLSFCPPRSIRVPFLLTVHDLTPLERPRDYPAVARLYWDAMLRELAPRARRIATPSQWVKDRLVERFGLGSDRIEVVYSGVEPAFHAPAEPAADAELRRSAGLDGPYWLSCGSLQPRKNLEVAIRALAQLARRGVEVPRLIAVGRPGRHARRLTDLARALGVEWALVLAGPVPDRTLAALYRGAAAFVFPSWAEGFGVPPLEAMAAGAPVLAARTSCLPEILGRHAVWADPADEASWCDAWQTLREESPADRAARIAAAREWSRRYTWDDTAARWRAMLEGAASELARG